jgi:hypothetical protein
MSDPAIGLFYEIILRAQKQIEYLETGISEEIKSRIKAGAAIPGFTIEPSIGRETWSRSTAEIAALGDLLGVNLRKEELITPNQARKAGLDDNVINEYTKREQKGLKLIPVNNQKARRIFNHG